MTTIQENIEAMLPATPEAWLTNWMNESGKTRNEARAVLIEQLQGELKKESGRSAKADLLRLTLDYMTAGQFTKSLPKNVKAAKNEALAWNLQRCIGHLAKLANDGDREATNLLAHHTLDVSKWLSNMRLLRSNQLRPIARKSIFWPVLKSRCLHYDDTGRALSKVDQALLRDLEVGCDHWLKGQKVVLTDELGELTLKLIDQIESYRNGGLNIVAPTGWRLRAISLPRLAPKKRVVDMWAEVMGLVLIENFHSRDGVVSKYRHLVSKTKTVGVKTIFGELQHLLKSKLTAIVGLGCRGTNLAP